MKGGVGKTTIAAHVMRVLYRSLLKRTLLVDFDPQFNLTQTIISQANYEKLKQANQTILSVMEPPPQPSLFSVTSKLPPPPKLEEVSLRLLSIAASSAALYLVPGDFGLVKYTLVDDAKALAPIRARFKQFIGQARSE